jgi:hypothetical protein
LWNCTAHSKQLPADVFTLHDDNLGLLLARMWEGDGTISVKGAHADYDTVSPRLAADVQHVLLRLGIQSRCYERQRPYRGRIVRSFVITVTGAENLIAFYRRIGRKFLSPAKRSRAQAVAIPSEARMSKDVIPSQVHSIIRRVRDTRGLSWRDIGRATKLGMREIQSTSTAKRGFRRWVIGKLGEHLRCPELTRLAESDVYWDRIVGIEPAGEEQTYDLSIDGNHNFLANDFVVHNSHAASFALIAYATCWMRKHYLPEFVCSLLDAQPMGFYSPATIVGDAQRHGLEVRPIDVTKSAWDCTLEANGDAEFGFAVRMGLRWVKGIQISEGERILGARGDREFVSVEDFVRRTHLSVRTHTTIAETGALGPLVAGSSGRRDALWQVTGWVRRQDDPLDLGGDVNDIRFAKLSKMDEIFWDYRASDHSTRGHPLEPMRGELKAKHLPDARSVSRGRDGQRIDYVGIVICRQQPGTASGVTFMTLEDETGFVNLVVWAQTFEKYSTIIRTTSLLGVTGRLQVQEGIVHLIAEQLWHPDLSKDVVEVDSRDFH